MYSRQRVCPREHNLQAPNSPLYVGIDLGTTNSVAVLFDGTNVAAVRNGQGSVLTPSVVRIDARGNIGTVE